MTGVQTCALPIFSWLPITVTSSWTRVSLVTSAASSTENWIGFQLTTSGDEIWVWGCQVELVTYQTAPSGTYYNSHPTPTTAAAYYGPRFDNYYNTSTSTWQSRGLLIEGTRTNLVVQSNTFNSATSWLKSSVGTILQDVTGIDGLTSEIGRAHV